LLEIKVKYIFNSAPKSEMGRETEAQCKELRREISVLENGREDNTDFILKPELNSTCQ